LTKSISIHSHKGGSGKTLVAMNLAAHLAQNGQRVALMDMDLTAPSLGTYVPSYNGKKINDYLLKGAEVNEIFYDATHVLGENVPGKLFMAFGDTSGTAIAETNMRDNDALLNDLYLLMELVRNKLAADPWNVDYVIIDTSPGLTTHAINGVAITDHVIMLLRLVNADLGGTKHFLQTLYQSVKPKVSLIVNQIAEHILAEGGKEKIERLVDHQIISTMDDGDIKLAGIIATDKDVITSEVNFAMESMDLDTNTERPRPIHVINPTTQNFTKSFMETIRGILDE
jgi:MinD-like ATPase involved in chromosome partitioning or flagellar assembly